MADELRDDMEDAGSLCISCKEVKKDCIMTTVTLAAKSNKQEVTLVIEGFICNECTAEASEEAVEMATELKEMGAKTSLTMNTV